MLSSIVITNYSDCKEYVKYTYQITISPPFYVRVPNVVFCTEGKIHTLYENGVVAWIRYAQPYRRKAPRGSERPANAQTTKPFSFFLSFGLDSVMLTDSNILDPCYEW
jgi:hypothetical protein